MQHVNVISYQLWPNGARPGGQGPVVSADSLDWPVLHQPWIMDDREPAGLTGNNSLPRGPTPFTGHNATARKGWGRAGGTQPWNSHFCNPLFPFVHHALQEARVALVARLPRVTSHYQHEIRGATDQCLYQVQGQTKSHMSWMRRRD